VKYSKKQLFWTFQFPSAAVWTRFVKRKRIFESESRLGDGRARRIGCAGLE